jgi:hypothetical protein
MSLNIFKGAIIESIVWTALRSDCRPLVIVGTCWIPEKPLKSAVAVSASSICFFESGSSAWLLILVHDHANARTTLPSHRQDWYTGGGLDRKVERYVMKGPAAAMIEQNAYARSWHYTYLAWLMGWVWMGRSDEWVRRLSNAASGTGFEYSQETAASSVRFILGWLQWYDYEQVVISIVG